jgi:hypothetical protein
LRIRWDGDRGDNAHGCNTHGFNDRSGNRRGGSKQDSCQGIHPAKIPYPPTDRGQHMGA